MNGTRQEAVEAVARHVSATWEHGGDPREAYLAVGGQRVRADVASVTPRVAQGADVTKPRLRFDRVALRLVRRLHDALREGVPDGTTALVTITAPIHVPSKTAAALEDMIRTCLTRRPVLARAEDTVHGNTVTLCLVEHGVAQASKVVGFVHNPETDSSLLLDRAASLVECISIAASRRAPAGFSGDRWLILTSADPASFAETYRHVCSQLSLSGAFARIVTVFGGGRVEILTESS